MKIFWWTWLLINEILWFKWAHFWQCYDHDEDDCDDHIQILDGMFNIIGRIKCAPHSLKSDKCVCDHQMAGCCCSDLLHIWYVKIEASFEKQLKNCKNRTMAESVQFFWLNSKFIRLKWQMCLQSPDGRLLLLWLVTYMWRWRQVFTNSEKTTTKTAKIWAPILDSGRICAVLVVKLQNLSD